jgi:hypothetical protein
VGHTVTKALAAIAIVNFVAFIVIGVYLGGYARGHVSGMPYYLQWYGHATEVSRTMFQYSKWHSYAMLTTHAVAIGAWMITRTRPRSR